MNEIDSPVDFALSVARIRHRQAKSLNTWPPIAAGSRELILIIIEASTAAQRIESGASQYLSEIITHVKYAEFAGASFRPITSSRSLRIPNYGTIYLMVGRYACRVTSKRQHTAGVDIGQSFARIKASEIAAKRLSQSVLKFEEVA